MSRYSKKRILEEIEKCEVVCANCHMIRTRERGQLLAVTPGREGGL